MQGYESATGCFRHAARAGSGHRALLAALVGLIGLGAAAVVWIQGQPDPRVSLFPGTRLRDQELSRMQLAFGTAGLNDFELREASLWVPRSRRNVYLKALHDRGAAPEFTQSDPSQPSFNPWATREQQRELAFAAKKKLIRQMVLQLGFVADALVDLDELTVPGWPPVTTRRVAIAVRPEGGRILEMHQVDAIRHTVCGQLAGLRPEDIVVTDLAAGHAYVGSAATSPVDAERSAIALEQSRIRQRIAERLASWGDRAKIDVQIVPADRPVAQARGSSAAPQIRNAQLILNQPASIEADPGDPHTAATPASRPAERPPQTYRVDVVVQLPAEAAGGSEWASLAGAAAGSGDGIEPLLFSDQLDCRPGSVQFRFAESATPAGASPAASPRPPRDLGRTVSLFGLIAAGGLLVLAIVWLRWAGARDAGEPCEACEPGSAPPRAERPLRPAAAPRREDSPPRDDSKQRLRQLVDDDPDRAAAIIKRWIQDAA